MNLLEDSERDQYWMQKALQLAKHAEALGEVPVGALVVLNDELVGEGWNSPILLNDPTAHAEIRALKNASETIGNYRLMNTSLYVTLEPCLMCVGAIVHARVKHLIYGASDLKAGAVCSQIKILELPFLNYRVKYKSGVLAKECSEILSQFFKNRRLKKNCYLNKKISTNFIFKEEECNLVMSI